MSYEKKRFWPEAENAKPAVLLHAHPLYYYTHTKGAKTMSKRAELEEKLAAKCAEISAIKARHRDELTPHVEDERAIRRELGPIYAGFAPGDILESAPDRRMGRTRRARVIEVYASYGATYDAKGIAIKKDGTEGETINLHSYQGWKKV